MRSPLSTAFFSVVVNAARPAQPRHGDPSAPIHSVPALDLRRYAGLWYEIARYPNRFERDCYAATAEYRPRADGRISVVNRCRKGSLGGPEDGVTGTAKVVAPGQLKVGFVRFLPFLRGDYWVLDVTPDYTLAVVGEPRRKFGWILARDPHPDAAAMESAFAVLRRNGYDPALIERVVQP